METAGWPTAIPTAVSNRHLRLEITLIKKTLVCLIAVVGFAVLGCNPAAPPKDHQNNADFNDQNAVKNSEKMQSSTDPSVEVQNGAAAVGGPKGKKYAEQQKQQQDQ